MHDFTVFVAMGSNLASPKEKISSACKEIISLKSIKNFKISSLYVSEPISAMKQADFINAVCTFKTTLQPQELLQELQKIENKLGRVRGVPNCPRTMDLDLLFFEDVVMQTKELTLPHPCWRERLFVVKPLSDLIKNIVVENKAINLENLMKEDSLKNQRVDPL
jgi:2-amino-4-hydroxy-6-hydroxymethyldihydropteridine diphosphokinase